MNAVMLYRHVLSRGLRFGLADGALTVEPAHRITDNLRPLLREWRSGLLALVTVRERLLQLALIREVPADLVTRLDAADLSACVGLNDEQFVAYLGMLRDSAERMAGRPAPCDTSPARCAHCGPVLLSPELTRQLPLVGGWRVCAGCPWCHVRGKGGVIPRPEGFA